MTYCDWLNIWLENYVKPTAKHKTYIRYSEIFSRHISPRLGSYELNELKLLVLQQFVTALSLNGNIKTNEGLAANSVNGIITVMQSSLKVACGIGEIAEYTANKIKRPKAREKQIACFSVSEQRKIEQAILNGEKPKKFGVVLCLYTGLRIGELLAHTWQDIDFRKSTVSVTKTCYDSKDATGRFTRITDTPKTETSRRVIPLPKQLIEHLKNIKRSSKSEYVISSCSGDRGISVRAYQRSFAALQARLGIERKNFHALRHTIATRALESGMDVKSLSEILGHKNPTVTLNRYVHSLMDHKREMMNRLGKQLATV